MFNDARRPLTPCHPSPIDVRAMLSMLRAEMSEIGVEYLAHVVAINAVAALHWLTVNWGVGANLRDPFHPARAAMLDDPASPMAKLGQARAALDNACWRYRMNTDRDGLALAQELIERGCGVEVARYALRPLLDRTPAAALIDDLLRVDEPQPPAEPTPAERRATAMAAANWALSYPDMGDLAERLAALLVACEAAGDDTTGQAVTAAVEAVRGATEAALHRGCEVEVVQFALREWSRATGGPQINVNVGASEE